MMAMRELVVSSPLDPASATSCVVGICVTFCVLQAGVPTFQDILARHEGSDVRSRQVPVHQETTCKTILLVRGETCLNYQSYSIL